MAMFLLGWAASTAGYLLLAGQTSRDELLTAGLGGLAAALWALSLRHGAPVRFRFERAAAGALGRALAGLLGAVAKVGLRLLRAIFAGAAGEVSEQPFVHGPAGEPADAARRAVAILALSVSPDAFAIRAHAREARLAAHGVLRAPPDIDMRWGR